MTLRWCLTSLRDPSNHLVGPFETRTEAERRAFMLTSREGRISAIWNGRMPVTLVPTPCRGHVVTSYVPQLQPKAQAKPKPQQKSSLAARAPMPPTLYKLSESKLRYFCAQLNVALPSSAHTRAEIIAIIEKELQL